MEYTVLFVSILVYLAIGIAVQIRQWFMEAPPGPLVDPPNPILVIMAWPVFPSLWLPGKV